MGLQSLEPLQLQALPCLHPPLGCTRLMQQCCSCLDKHLQSLPWGVAQTAATVPWHAVWQTLLHLMLCLLVQAPLCPLVG